MTEYSRPAAGKEIQAKNMRTEEALNRSMHYLMTK